MTTKKDDLKKRLNATGLGQGKEQTVGVPRDGFVDPTGEFPKREYFFGNSISKKARGIESVRVSPGGGADGIPVDLAIKNQSQYPFAQYKETASGHIVGIDDTPGAECIVVLHRTGAGVEFLPDGSMVVRTKDKRIDIVGDDHTVIVEGSGKMVYNGSLELTVSGDYNVNVGGDYNVSVGGNKREEVLGSARYNVQKNHSLIVGRDKDERVVGSRSAVVMVDNVLAVKGDHITLVEGDGEVCIGQDYHVSAEDTMALSSLRGIMTAGHLNVSGYSGVIGGENIEHYGNVYAGPDDGKGTTTTFYGSLVGLATEATVCKFAQKADEAYTAHHATHAQNAQAAITAGTASPGSGVPGSYTPATISTITTDPNYTTYHVWHVEPKDKHMPTADLIGGVLGLADIGIKKVNVDTVEEDLLNKLIKLDDYNDKFNKTPTIKEIRHLLKEQAHLNDTELTSALVAEGRLNPRFNRSGPYVVGRRADRNPNARFGYNSIGNNPLENKSKRFKPS